MHFICNWFLAFSLSYALAFLIRKKTWHFSILTFVGVLLATVSKEKFESLGLPLIAVDFTMGKNADVLANYINTNTILLFVYALVLPFVALNIKIPGKKSLWQKMKAYPKLRMSEARSSLAAILSLPMWVALFVFGKFSLAGVILDVRAQTPDLDYIGNGDIVSFTLSFYTNRNHVKKYKISPKAKALAQATLESENRVDPSCQTNVQPDILIVMVESMFDPVQIPGVKFSEDPLAPIRSMGYEENKSYFFVPSFGGQTANTEFEFLTGSTHRFFPLGTVQYQHHVYSPANSLARMLATKDYHAIAIHNYTRRFWRRHEVYPLLGFDEFYGVEDIEKAVTVERYDGKKPLDKALARFVPDQMKKHQNNPGLYFVVTMGTHGPYHKYLYDTESKLSVQTPQGLSERAHILLNNYTNFLADSSKALSDLFRYALGRSKPTVVLYFGDHLPGLPADTFALTGYDKWMKQEVDVASNELKVVPMSVLNNFGCKFKVPKPMASNCMASHLVSQLYKDLPNDKFWKYNKEFCKKHPLIYDGIDPSKLDGDLADYAGFIYENLFKWSPSAR